MSPAEAVSVSKTGCSLISSPPSPWLICGCAHLDGDGSARRGGDSSPPVTWQVWESRQVRFPPTEAASRGHGSTAGRAAALRSASLRRHRRAPAAPHRGAPPLRDREPPQTLTNTCRKVSQSSGTGGCPLPACSRGVGSLITWRTNFPHQQI